MNTRNLMLYCNKMIFIIFLTIVPLSFKYLFAQSYIFKSLNLKVIEKRDLGSLNEYVVERNGKKMLIYETKDGKYLIVGTVIDAKTGRNLTKERYAQINKVKFANIQRFALKEAIHLRFGKGGKKLVMISDPDCPFCRKAHQYLKNKDIDLYVFLFPLPIHPDAERKSKIILCSENPAKVYNDVMEGKSIKGQVCKEARNKLSYHISIGKLVGATGTPTFVLEDGTKIEGFDVYALERYLK